MGEPVNRYSPAQLRTIDTVQAAKKRGLKLEDEERHALWKLAKGGIAVDAFLGEEDASDKD